MHDKMMKMLMSKKKEGKKLSDSEKKSKLQALGGMRDMASKMMGDKLKGLKKVSVESDSKSGLKKGLEKAEGILDEEPAGYSSGGSVKELPDHANPPKDPGPQGRKIGQLPEEFDRDEDHVESEHKYDQQPRQFSDGGEVSQEEKRKSAQASMRQAFGFNEGGDVNEDAMPESPGLESSEHESLDQMVEECNDPEQIDELIRKLEEKKQSLS